MSYKPETILERKVPFEAPAEGEDDLRPYNEVRVIGQSPVQSGVRVGEWVGQQGDLISVAPTGFGPVVDRPAGELERDYTIKWEPPLRMVDRQIIERVIPGPSPEQQFATAASEANEKPSPGRGRRRSPVVLADD